MVDPTELGVDAIRPISRREFERMVEAGVFDEDEHVELLHGWLVRVSPAHPPHAFVAQKLNMVLTPALVGRADVRVQSSWAAGEYHLPEPDVAVVPVDDRGREHPTRAFLMIEIADSSLRKDRRIKAPIYAAAGVPEYWIVDVNGRSIEVYREPGPSGYARVEHIGENGTVSPVAFPDVRVDVRRILPAPV